MRVQNAGEVQKRGAISLHFFSEEEAKEFVRKNELDLSHCKHYFQEGAKVTLATNAFVDMYNLYHQVKDFVIGQFGCDNYQLRSMKK